MAENIVLENYIRTINEEIYISPKNDEILYSELNNNKLSNNKLALITKKNPTHIQIFDIVEQTIKSIPTHNKINLIKFNPRNASQIACASEEKKCIIINFNDEQPIINVIPPKGIINSIAWNTDGNRIAYGSDKNIIIVNIDNTYTTLTGHSQPIQTIDWCNNKIISGCKGKDGQIFVWEHNVVTDSFTILKKIREKTEILKFIPNNNYFISYNNNNIEVFKIDGTIIHSNIPTIIQKRIQNNENEFENYFINETKFNVNNITFLQNSNEFLCSCKEGYIIFDYNVANNNLIINTVSTLSLENKLINFCQNKNLIFINSEGKYINIRRKINFMDETPLIDNNFCNLYSDIKFVYIKLFFTDYKFFTNYIIKNKIDENYQYEKFFLQIINSNGIDQNVKTNLIEFVNYIAQFLNSVNITPSSEINKLIEKIKLEEIIQKYLKSVIDQNIDTQKKFLKYVNNSSGDEVTKKLLKKKCTEFFSKLKDNRKNYKKKILTIYTNFVRSYLKFLYNYYNKPFNFNFLSIHPDIMIQLNPEQELNFLLNKDANFYNDRIKYRFKYIGADGINGGGITKQFFANLEEQLNKHIFIENEIINIEKKKRNARNKKTM